MNTNRKGASSASCMCHTVSTTKHSCPAGSSPQLPGARPGEAPPGNEDLLHVSFFWQRAGWLLTSLAFGCRHAVNWHFCCDPLQQSACFTGDAYFLQHPTVWQRVASIVYGMQW